MYFSPPHNLADMIYNLFERLLRVLRTPEQTRISLYLSLAFLASSRVRGDVAAHPESQTNKAFVIYISGLAAG